LAHHPLNLPLFRGGFDLELSKPITILVGANSSGRSTILEVIASHCGFALTGGTKNVAHRTAEEVRAAPPFFDPRSRTDRTAHRSVFRHPTRDEARRYLGGYSGDL
jgi:predicted ATPase